MMPSGIEFATFAADGSEKIAGDEDAVSDVVCRLRREA